MTAVAPSQVFSKSSFFATTSWEVKMGENERRQVDSPGQGASNDTSLMKIGGQTAKKRGWLQEIGLKFENFDPCVHGRSRTYTCRCDRGMHRAHDIGFELRLASITMMT